MPEDYAANAAKTFHPQTVSVKIANLMNSKTNIEDLLIALEESVKLQSHYANLLNIFDGGKRLTFKDAESWIDRLRKTGKIKTTI